jgi:hypothetical protein
LHLNLETKQFKHDPCALFATDVMIGSGHRDTLQVGVLHLKSESKLPYSLQRTLYKSTLTSESSFRLRSTRRGPKDQGDLHVNYKT